MWHIPCLDRDPTGLTLTVARPASGNLMRTSPRAAQATSQKPPTSSGFYVICCVARGKKGWLFVFWAQDTESITSHIARVMIDEGGCCSVP